MTWLKSLGSLIPNLLRACLPCANVNQQSPWADDLPLDIWEMIFERLSQPEDFFRFRCVCRSWRHSIVPDVIKGIHHRPSRRQIPWLTPAKHDDAAGDLRRFYSPSAHKIYNLRLPEEAGHMRSCGSSYGWLAMLGPTNEMFLLDPLSGRRIPLPPLWMGSCSPNSYSVECKLAEFIKKVTLSCSPTDGDGSDCVALAIYHRGTDVTFARPGDRAWSVIHLDQRRTNYDRFQDVVYFRGKFYGVMIDGRLVTFDVQKKHARFELLGRALSVGTFCDDRYLVESSSGDLLQVYGYPLDPRKSVEFPRARFWVLKLDTDRCRWIELESLGDQALFLSCCSSMSVRASDGGGECRKNCIYFTGGGSEYAFNVGDIGLRRGVGVFSLEEGSIQSHDECGPYVLHLSPPLWTMPNLY